MKTPVETLAANLQTSIEAKAVFLANSEQHSIFEAAVSEGILRYQKAGRLYIAGNGGSASTATTMANDIGFDIIKKTKTNKPFRVFSIVENNSVVTAISNDVGYENIFINQLKIHYRSGDSIILISASGNSPNILKAAEWVKDKGGAIIGFLGFTGGNLIDLCDVKIHVKSES